MRSTSGDSLWRLWLSAAKQVRLALGGGNQLEQHHAEREMAMHDLVIRGATVVDGLGHDPIRTDLTVRDGRHTCDTETRTHLSRGGRAAAQPGVSGACSRVPSQIMPPRSPIVTSP